MYRNRDTAVASGSSGGGNKVAAKLASDVSASAAYADLLSVSFTPTTTSAALHAAVSGLKGTLGTVYLKFVVAGADSDGTFHTVPDAYAGSIGHDTKVTGLTVGTPITIKVQWKVDTGTYVCSAQSTPLSYHAFLSAESI